jgi:hypothetical protein
VFGRGERYSPADDAIVRRQAHSLRQKLRQYYEAEGASDPVRLELPVGRYVPVFHRVVEPVAPRSEAPTAPAPEPRRTSRRIALVGGGTALVGAGWLGGRATAPRPRATMAGGVRDLWARWLTAERVVLCFSNPLTAVVRHVADAADGRGARVEPGSDVDRRLRRSLGLPAQGELRLTGTIGQGKIGEAQAALRLAAFMGKAGIGVRPTQSRFINREVFASEHVVVLGHPGINPWVDRLLARRPLKFESRDGAQPPRIVDTASPSKASFAPDYAGMSDGDDLTVQYALVSMLPGADGRRQLLLVNGLYSHATEMAVQVLTSDDHVGMLVDKLRAHARSTAGWYFQAVLRAEVRDDVASRGEIITLRMLDE